MSLEVKKGDRIKVYDLREPRGTERGTLRGKIVNIHEDTQGLKLDDKSEIIHAKRITYDLDTGYTLEILVLPEEEGDEAKGSSSEAQ